MGNKTNDQNWAATERLRFIEVCAWWKGIVNRQDLADLFGISMAQASSDLQRYLEMNPGAFVYNLRQKRYEPVAEMKCVMARPCLDEAVSRFLGGSVRGVWTGCGEDNEDRGYVALLKMPLREASADVERRVFLAIFNGFRVRVKYASVNSGKEEWRWLMPQALAHSGARWHVRAWCETNHEFRDFTLSRIAEVEWSREQAEPPHEDLDWTQWVTIQIRPHHDLSEGQRKAVERDYAMRGGVLKVKVRKAMEGYLRERLGLAMADGSPALRLLEL
ncbi:MAG: WYL domain-containing protein [Verrucomicrobiota bacterium]